MIKFLNDDKGQGAAEMILLFGGIIIIAIFSLIYYRRYTEDLGKNINETEVQSLKENITNLKTKFE